MPAFNHVGLSELDYSPGTVRTEMSDAMYASLLMLPNLLAALSIGQFGGGGTGVGAAVMQLLHYWTESRLNPRTVTDLSAGLAANATPTFITLSFSDAALIDVGYVLKDKAQTLLVAEQLFVTSFVVGASNVQVNVNRGLQRHHRRLPPDQRRLRDRGDPGHPGL